MIPYDELAAALERWRIRNGLPIVAPHSAAPRRNGQAPTTVVHAAPIPAAPVATAFREPPSEPPPARALALGPPPPEESEAPDDAYAMEVTGDDAMGDEVTGDEVNDAEVVESHDVYDNEGSDFAMTFGAPLPPDEAMALAPDDADELERTKIGATPPPSDGPAWPEPRGAESNPEITATRDPALDDDLS